jgi:Ca2+-binding RTX toxin-like protein
MDDVIKGSNSKPNYLYDRLGDDQLDDRGDADILVGGNGNDYFIGDNGADTIYGDWSALPEIQDAQGNQQDPHVNNSVGPDLWFPTRQNPTIRAARSSPIPTAVTATRI